MAVEASERLELREDPLVWPFSAAAPPEVPRVVLRSKEEAECSFSGDRVEFIYPYRKGEPVDQALSEFGGYLRLLINLVYGFELLVTRVGFVAMAELRVDEEGAGFLRRHYLAVNGLQELTEIQLSLLRTIELQGRPVDFWLRLSGNKASQVLRLAMELNTKEDEPGFPTRESCVGLFEEFGEFLRQPARNLIALGG